MPDNTATPRQDPPTYERRFGWNVALPQPKTWKQDRKAIENVYALQYTEAYNQARTADAAWAKLTPTEQQRSWATRGSGPSTDDLTAWEQRASMHEAYQRTALALHRGGYRTFLPSTFVEVERVPARLQAIRGGPYAYRVWSFEYTGQGGDHHWPHPPGMARDVDELRAVIARAPNRHYSFPTEVFTEDVALRHALRAHDIRLGPRYSPEIAQERRQFYTLEAQHAVREARSTRDWIEADWQELTPKEQQAAYERAGQGARATVWEERLAAHLKLARREQMIPYASQGRSDLPDAFAEVEGKAGRDAPYRITRWTRIWDADLGLTRFEHEPVQQAPTMEAIADLTHNGRMPIFADALGMRAQLRQHGLTVVEQEHLAAQHPQLERRYEREQAHALGD